MPLLIETVAGPLGLRGHAVKLSRKSEGEICDIDHLLHLAQPFLINFPRLKTDQCPEILLVRTQCLGDFTNHQTALRSRYQTPAQKGRFRTLYSLFVIGFSRQRDRSYCLARGRIERGEDVAALGVLDAKAGEDSVCVKHEKPLGPVANSRPSSLISWSNTSISRC